MAGRLSVACVSLLAVLAFLLLFASASNVEAVTYKTWYGTQLTCAGTDGCYGDVKDGRIDVDRDGDVADDPDDDCKDFTTVEVIDGQMDIDDNGSITAADDGFFTGVEIIDGDIDIDGDGFITTADDGHLWGDDSCEEDATYGPYGADLTADVISHFEIPSLCNEPEATCIASPAACDNDGDTVVNDGCPQKGIAPETGGACADNLDNDTDGKVNDGCPAVGSREQYSNFSYLLTGGTPANWYIATDKEIPNGALMGTMDAISTLALANSVCNLTLPVHIDMFDCTTANFEGVNDGCPNNSSIGDGVKEKDHRCNDNQDNDNDGFVNEGCPAAPAKIGTAETGTECDNDEDDDGDTVVNDGCAETGTECANDTDDDGDGDPMVEWDGTIDGANLTYGHYSGLPAGCNRYPQHVNIIMEGLKPRARYFGFVVVVSGMAPTQLQYLIYSTEQLTAVGTPPESDMGENMGYMNRIILSNPLVPAPPGGALDEFCAPLSTDTNLHGHTDGEGHINVLPGGVWDPADVPAIANSSHWTVPDACGNGIDDDADTTVDELCTWTRVRNPKHNTGIYGTGSHLTYSYSESYRDADGDTIPNNEDECPFNPDVGAPSAFTHIDASCGTIPPCTNFHPGGTADDADGDLYRNQADNCPCVWQNPDPAIGQADADLDDIGDACDTLALGNGPDIADGHYLNDMPIGSICIDDFDDDFDGWCNNTELLLGSIASNTGNPANQTPPYERSGLDVDNNDVDDCVDVLDNDNDGYCDVFGCTMLADPDCGVPADNELGDAPDGTCGNGLDDDNDGTCDDVGCTFSADAGCSTPEVYGIDTTVNAAQNPPGAAPQSCDNWTYYDVNSGNPHGGVAPQIDDDGDTWVNAADPGCASSHTWDADADGVVTLNPCEGIVAGAVTTEDLRTVIVWQADSEHDADDLCLVYNSKENYGENWWSGLNDATVTVNAPGCNPPLSVIAGTLTDGNEGIQVVWDSKCVDEGESVTITFRTDATAQPAPAPYGEPCFPSPIWTDAGVPLRVDNCPADPNPTQLNTDGDSQGDACDTDDDQDKTKDVKEWAQGSDPKNVCDPASFDLNKTAASIGVINILDVLMFSNVILGMDCNPPADYRICEPVYRHVDPPSPPAP